MLKLTKKCVLFFWLFCVADISDFDWFPLVWTVSEFYHYRKKIIKKKKNRALNIIENSVDLCGIWIHHICTIYGFIIIMWYMNSLYLRGILIHLIFVVYQSLVFKWFINSSCMWDICIHCIYVVYGFLAVSNSVSNT